MEDLINELISKLNWDTMDSEIAIPAVEEIISNFPGNPEALLAFNSDHLFGLLLKGDIPYDDWFTFISLRNEIESSMFNGASYYDAINEWFK